MEGLEPPVTGLESAGLPLTDTGTSSACGIRTREFLLEREATSAASRTRQKAKGAPLGIEPSLPAFQTGTRTTYAQGAYTL